MELNTLQKTVETSNMIAKWPLYSLKLILARSTPFGKKRGCSCDAFGMVVHRLKHINLGQDQD